MRAAYTNRIAAMHHLQERGAAGEVVTGLLFVDPQAVDMHEHINTVDRPLNQLGVSTSIAACLVNARTMGKME